MEIRSLECIGLANDEQLVFINYFRKLPAKPPTVIRFFFRTDYYTVHGEDAEYTSEQSCIPTHLKTMGKDEDPLTYVVLNKNIFVEYIRDLLLVKQYRVEVYVNKNNKQNDWDIEYKGSPGNIGQFEDLLYERADPVITNILMSINLIGDAILGIACINTTENLFAVGEISDNEFFTELEGLLAQICPRECLLPEGTSPALETLKKVVTRAGICITRLKRSEYNSENVVQDLNRLLYFGEDQQKDAQAMPEVEKVEALKALSAGINYQNLLGDDCNFNKFSFRSLNLREFVRLDASALKALNVYPEELRKQKNKARSLFGILDNCATGQGRRLLWQWLNRPLKDLNLINERLDIVETLVGNTEIREVLHTSHLNKLPDLMKLIKRLGGKKAKLEDCYKAYQCVTFLPGLLSLLRKLSNESVRSCLADPLLELLTDLEKYTELVEETIDLDSVDEGEFLIKNTFDEQLNDLHEKKTDLMTKIKRQLDMAADDLGLSAEKQIKLELNTQFGYLMRVTLKEEPLLRKKSCYNILQTVRGGVRFTTKTLDDLNEDYTDVRNAYENAQEVVVQEILKVAAGYIDPLRNINILIAKVDVFVSLAIAAATAPIPYVRPTVHPMDAGVLKMKQVRHPCLEMTEMSYIANDVSFDQKGKTFHLITGPNMGGKSTFIRSVGVAALMAHIGSFVPCEEAEISILDSIYCRLGADDNLLRGMSTFMVEMVETSDIIRSSTKNSLVIIDELGRGTSTYDGCGLAASIATYLAVDIGCFSLFATHFHELSVLPSKHPNMSNLYVTAVESEEGITPLFQVKEGSCDKSFGIHCARICGFPEEVLDDAETILKKMEDDLGLTGLASLDTQRKRKIVQEADELMLKTLEKCADLDLELSDEELVREVKRIKTELESHGNIFIDALLNPPVPSTPVEVSESQESLSS